MNSQEPALYIVKVYSFFCRWTNYFSRSIKNVGNYTHWTKSSEEKSWWHAINQINMYFFFNRKCYLLINHGEYCNVVWIFNEIIGICNYLKNENFQYTAPPPPKKKKRKQNNEVIEFSRAKLILTPFLVFCRESWLVEDRKLA